jgi:hypothetical protein
MFTGVGGVQPHHSLGRGGRWGCHPTLIWLDLSSPAGGFLSPGWSRERSVAGAGRDARQRLIWGFRFALASLRFLLERDHQTDRVGLRYDG